MPRRQPLPRLWMMTDERQGDRLLAAVRALPEGAGIVFRHYSLAETERRRLFDRVREEAGARNVVLMLGGPAHEATKWGAHGSHGWNGERQPDLLRSVSVHDSGEMKRANALGADFAFVSPVFPTRSHPGKPTLGHAGLAELAASAAMPVIALGGMTQERATTLAGIDIHGWAAVDAWTPA